MQSLKEIFTAFREKGFKITPQRRLIFDILANNQNHPCTEDVYQAAILTMPDISRTTVYSTLNELVDFGFLDTVKGISKKPVRFDPMTSPHHHLYCQNCGKIIDIDLDISSITPPSDVSATFEIVKKQITFFGFCQDCRSN